MALVAAIAAQLAFAKHEAAIGTGVVVIETQLGYQQAAAAGTGIVLTSSGEILTNNHVIRGATKIRLVIPGTGRTYKATVLGYDISADVAVLKATNASNLKAVSLANSSRVKVGQPVTAVGNAGGTGALTTTTGEVTGIAKAITVSDDRGGSSRLRGLIETDAALQPGDSGGPLYDKAGRVIGMDAVASVGYGFRDIASTDGYAIPINAAIAIVKQIEAGKSSAAIHVGRTAFLGIETTSRSSIPGATIAAVLPGSPAETAGLVSGDVITAVDGRAVVSTTGLTTIMLGKTAGSTVSITSVDPFGTSRTASVTLASGPPQ